MLKTDPIENLNFSKDSKAVAKYLWEKVLVKPKNYFNSIDKIKELSFDEIFTHKLEIKPNVYIFPNERARQELQNLLKLFDEVPGIKRISSRETIYNSIVEELKTEIISSLELEPLRGFEEILKSLFSRISESVKSHDVYFPLEGLHLVDIHEIDLGLIKIFEFNQETLENLLLKQDDIEHNQTCRGFIERNFLNKICIKCSCLCDFQSTKELAKTKTREAINFFRYIICSFFYERISENRMKINILSETYIDENQFFTQESGNGSIILSYAKSRKAEKFSIDAVRMKDIRENLHFDRIVKLLNNEDCTELEGSILTAIYWIGEAQNEFDLDVAFLKYWTALECIFTGSERPTDTLSKGISIVNTFSGYSFVKVEELEDVYRDVKRLYDKRCDIVHRGMKFSTNQNDISKICKYTAWSIRSFLHLCSIGYTNMSEVNNHINRLYCDLNL